MSYEEEQLRSMRTREKMLMWCGKETADKVRAAESELVRQIGVNHAGDALRIMARLDATTLNMLLRTVRARWPAPKDIEAQTEQK